MVAPTTTPQNHLSSRAAVVRSSLAAMQYVCRGHRFAGPQSHSGARGFRLPKRQTRRISLPASKPAHPLPVFLIPMISLQVLAKVSPGFRMSNNRVVTTDLELNNLPGQGEARERSWAVSCTPPPNKAELWVTLPHGSTAYISVAGGA